MENPQSDMNISSGTADHGVDKNTSFSENNQKIQSVTDLTTSKAADDIWGDHARPRSHTVPSVKQNQLHTEPLIKIEKRQDQEKVSHMSSYSISSAFLDDADEHPEFIQNAADPNAAYKSPKLKIKVLKQSITTWKNTLEPKYSWFLLFFSVMPINILQGMDFICFPIYYVEYVKYFHEASTSIIAFIVALEMATMSFSGE